eukprot:gnl/MRDRNA2_/MRDRNA2_129019_c0_seq1.p1 gnl/MRDRNA2_/MRDRNA2_129019_c0~~gnl/MRDRNA2_/MRDRNA2_129019_c0_seq1.p1  ORF type:complete len:783 (-),score=139.44 gnl/MRDRNA2_/MRDRNA2_129019_c0_seq1:128-2476(-)
MLLGSFGFNVIVLFTVIRDAWAQHLPLPKPAYDFEELEPVFDGAATRRHHREVFGFHVQKFNRALQLLRHTTAYRKILKHGGIDGLLTRLNEVPESVARMLRQHAGGYVNHELYFRTLRPFQGMESNLPQDGSTLREAIDNAFGSFQSFRDEFTDKAQQLEGVGWVWLVSDESVTNRAPADKDNGMGGWDVPHLRVIETERNDHVLQLNISYAPLLCLDVWEHAYFGQFYNDRKKYIEAWWNLVNWDEVESILESVTSNAAAKRLGVEDFRSDTRAELISHGGFEFSAAMPVQADNMESGIESLEVDAAGTVSSIESDDAKSFSGTQSTSKPPVAVRKGARLQKKPPVGVRPKLDGVDARPSSGTRCSTIDSFLVNLTGNPPGIRCISTQHCPLCSVSEHTALAGTVLVEWPASYVLGPLLDGSDLRQLDGDSLANLAAALLVQNRKLNSTWHEYLRFLHDEHDTVRRSALFWPQPLLSFVNLTLGLGDLRYCARAHKDVTSFFGASPEFLHAGEKTQLINNGGTTRQGSLFDAEIHWAVTVAFCRGVTDTASGKMLMLPGSELLSRGSAVDANVMIQPKGDDSGKWEMVALRDLNQGEILVLDGGASNIELLARGWLPASNNSRGPVLNLPNLDMGKVGEEKQLGWDRGKEHSCRQELQKPQLDHHDSLAFSRGLVLCIAFGIRLLENKAAAMEQSDSPQDVQLDKSDVMYWAYQLIAEGCQEVLQRYREAMSALAGEITGVVDVDVVGSLREALKGDLSLLERCLAQAQKQSEQESPKLS